jgi:triacylglycerol lipase
MTQIAGKTQGKRKTKPVKEIDYSKFNLDLCTKLAGISAASYKGSKVFVHSIRKLDMPEHKYQLVSHENAQAYIIWNDKEVIVSWRGTEPKEWKDITADLKFRKHLGNFGKVHRGFKGYVDKIYPKVEKKIKELTDGKWMKIYVTGHSLGGAAALICTQRLEENYHVSSCYTYGAPRPGGYKFALGFKTPVFRVRNNNDVVTKVPPSFIGYKHVGKLCYIDVDGNLRTGSIGWTTLFKNWIKGQFSRIGDGLRDHAIGEYEKLLQNAKRIHKE